MALSCAADLVNCGKLFVRWLHGSCLPAPSPKLGGEEGTFFTFFRELSGNPEISHLMHQIVNCLKVFLPIYLFNTYNNTGPKATNV